MIITIVKKNNYLDSIFLMKATKEVNAVEGVKDAVVVMGTDMNKTVLAEFGGLNEETKTAGANDLIIAVDSDDENIAEKVEKCLSEMMTKKDAGNSEDGVKEKKYKSFNECKNDVEGINMVTISLPSEYGALEAKRALMSGMNVFIFSDLTLEEEIELKKLGAEKDLLVMGPGAGTAVIDGVSIGLMSKVRKGNIGIAAASGSGLQEVAILAHQKGYGISQAIGTGGRDLSKEVGGSMMLRAIDFLANDDETKVIVLVSKPPHPETCKKIYDKVSNCNKPVVIFFLGGNPEEIKASGAYAPSTLEEAADFACKLADGVIPEDSNYIENTKAELHNKASELKAKLNANQKYMRGLFCGGTHSEEGVMLLNGMLGNLHSNIKFGGAKLLENRLVSEENSLVDMGDEIFTKGRPHPVMDPTILCDRFLQEGRDPETAVILFDIILGHGCHEDPVGCIEETIKQIREENEKEGRYTCIVASVCGTDLDPQNTPDQIKRLEDLGVIVESSNARAALLTGMIVC